MVKPQILLVQLEFGTWDRARAWSYLGNFAVEDGLRANGCECVTIPALCDIPDSSPLSWLHHAKDLLADRRFDQVWVWLVHNRYSDAFLGWLTELAPVRVGLIMESLRYSEEDCRRWPHLRERAGIVERQVKYMTHVLAADEHDAEMLNQAGSVRAVFWPSAVPSRFISATIERPSRRESAFYGELYGERKAWLGISGLKDLLIHPPSAEAATELPQLFNALHQQMSERLQSGWRPNLAALTEYVSLWRRLREAIFVNWLASLKSWSAIVNLPSLFQSYAGRVVEAMAAGRPVISWKIPNRPRTQELFKDGQEILLYPKDHPAALKEHVERIARDSDYARNIATAARAELLRSHTAEARARQWLDWIETGQSLLARQATNEAAVRDVRPPLTQSYAAARQVPPAQGPIPFEQVKWKGESDHDPTPTVADYSAQRRTFSTRLERVELEFVEGTTAGSGPSTSDVARQAHGGAMTSDAFYVNLFVNAPAWSAPHPNTDEAARWSKIAAFLEYILRKVQQKEPGRRLRILDVGCGRGWLTNLATMYGTCEGVEPVVGVVEYARKLFPHLRFESGTAEIVENRADFEPYDVILTSEVIEHVPHGRKENFLAQLFRLLKPDGHVVLTTPRGEMWEQWKTIAPPNQPVEDWVTEEQLRALFTSQGFVEMGLDRIHVEVPGLRYVPAPTPADLRSMNLLPIYQVWCCRRPVEQRPIPFTRTPKVSVIVPTYNRPDRLRAALASLAAQTYQDFEVIVVNDAGCDVEFIVAACADRHRITTITHGRNCGLAATRNSGLRAAKGIYIAYLDDDDRYLPNHLETLVGYLDRREYRVAYTDAWRVQERQSDSGYVETGRDVPYSHDFRPTDLLVSNYFPVLCAMHDRACLDDVGLFDESLFAHEDWDLWIRMATRFPFKHLPVRTAEFTWRTDGSSMTSGTRETYGRTTEIIYRKYRPYADLIGGVRDAQDKRLTEMRASGSAKQYVCSIVMPVWNRVELTKDCLTALAGLKDQPEYELIIVDNGSTDGTTDFLRQLSGDVRIIVNEENLGFAKACNQGAAAARGKYLVFLNNDTIPQPGWLAALAAEVDGHAEVGIVGSKLLYPDGTVQHAGVVRDCARRLPYHIYKGFAASHPAVNQRREFQIVTAACLLIRRALFEEVGGFDEGYVNGFEDVDLCLKVRERGYVVVYQPRSVVVHLESQTPGRKTHDDVNATRFLDRWKAQWWAADEDRHFHMDGFKLKRVFRNGREGGDILMFSDIKDHAVWAHVAAAQAAALKQDWQAVKHELSLASDWPSDPEILAWASSICEHLQEPKLQQTFLSRYLALKEAPKERLSLIRSLLEQNDLQGADRHLQSLLSSSPNHAEGLLLNGILCMQREQYEQAEHAFASAMREGADRRKCQMGMGMSSMGRAYTQGAWERFLEVLAENPG
ncbi:MAG: glycosyltransferase [Nitrospira sp.]|nr:glycosyltransferase [Nitrospira sp.]